MPGNQQTLVYGCFSTYALKVKDFILFTYLVRSARTFVHDHEHDSSGLLSIDELLVSVSA